MWLLLAIILDTDGNVHTNTQWIREGEHACYSKIILLEKAADTNISINGYFYRCELIQFPKKV